MGYADFCRLTPAQFAEAWQAHARRAEELEQSEWARTRWLATLLLQPHVRKRLSPRDVLVFPWERPVIPSKQSARSRLESLIRRRRGGGATPSE